MSTRNGLAYALAAALLDGPWDAKPMLARVRQAFELDREWMHTLVRATRSRFARPPDELVAWILVQPSFELAIYERVRVRRIALPAPEMRESPWRVPALATTCELAMWLGFEVELLADRMHLARNYRYAWIAKPRGGHRLLEAPTPRLRAAQRRILDGILAHIPPHDAAHGFRTQRSITSFATPHLRRDVVIRVDLQAFFASVFAPRVVGILRTAGYPDKVARTLAAICTHRTPAEVLATAPERDPIDLARLRTPHLPQGAPSSGALANLAAYRLDVRVAALARTLGAQYSRYADDLVLSGDRALARAAPTIVTRLGAIAIEEGFALNFRKTRVMTAGERQQITGLVVNDKLAVPRSEVERLRAILHNCVRLGPATQNREAHPDFRAHLLGRVAWVASIDPHKGARLRAAFDRIPW